MNFIGLTISDLSSPKLERACYGSIKSFLKYHDTNVIVYIIGDKEFKLKDDRIKLIRISKKNYNLSGTFINDYFYKIIDILVEKLICFSNHTNYVFFENDVFFFDSIEEDYNNLKYDGIYGSLTNYGKLSNQEYYGINTGFVINKNFKLNYTLNDIIKYFKTNTTCYPDEEFLVKWLKKDNMHYLDPKVNILVCHEMLLNNYVNKPKSAHYIGCFKPPFDNIKDVLKRSSILTRQFIKDVNEIFIDLQ